MTNRSRFYVLVCSVWFCVSLSAYAAQPIDYDIVYVRYPAKNPDGSYVTISQGEHPYKIAGGADLMLLHPDGSEEVLVDCEQCSVIDPFISLGGKTVYYAWVEKPSLASASWLYKIDLTKRPFEPVRLTFDDGFDSLLYAGNTQASQDQASTRDIRDMSPIQLSDGRILFTSNRSALTSFKPETNAIVKSSVQQLYVMDDHDGKAVTKQLSNMQRLENGTIQTAQHPIQLLSGEILFSSWQSVAHKYRYAMTSLFLVNPDGTDLKQFTEPHHHEKFLEHFITQLPNQDVISGLYYPSFDYGYGVLMRFPYSPKGADYYRDPITQYDVVGKVQYKSRREFPRKGTENITPHTTPRDMPAPNKSGKYSMPSVAKNGSLLVAYSKGYVNHFQAVCKAKGKPNRCDHLKSGIYLINDAQKSIVTDPSQLVVVKDEPQYNEIWPRAVLSYQALYGVDKPAVKTPSMNTSARAHHEATAFVGTSSMYNREGNEGRDGDPFASSTQRELHNGNWTIQGAESGDFLNGEIYGVRIVATPTKPFTQPIRRYGKDKKRWQKIKPLLHDQRLNSVVGRYSAFHEEKWEILGEFPLVHKQKGLVDQQRNPDSSWMAKIPAETPFLIQALDKNGMTLISELTWRALKPGEKRVDCGGCHAHSVEPLPFESTATGKGYLLHGVEGVDDLDPRIEKGQWDLTSGSIPLLSDKGVEFVDGGALEVEFRRDVFPILQRACLHCHSDDQQPPNFSGNAQSVYEYLKFKRDGMDSRGKKLQFKTPQISRYIRSPQARQSLLTWVAYGKRLDGRTNLSRNNDIDYPNAHPVLTLADKDKRAIARWIDMGGPIDFPQTDGFGYTDDSQLPIIHLSNIENAKDSRFLTITFGVHDVKSGINPDSVELKLFEISNPSGVFSKGEELTEIDMPSHLRRARLMGGQQGVYEVKLSKKLLKHGQHYIVEVGVSDKVGNQNVASQRIEYL